MFTRKLRAAALMAGAVLAGAVGVLAPVSASAAAATRTVTAAAAAPADVAVRSGWFGLETGVGYCLDSNAAGSVYVLPCQVPGNKYQDWSWTEWQAYSTYQGYYYFYSIKDQSTGRCLDSNAAGQVYTNPCQAPGNAYQDWYWGAGTFSGVSKFTDVATSLPLWGLDDRYSVSTFPQADENNWHLIQ
jgi:serine/threonine-protein kinase